MTGGWAWTDETWSAYRNYADQVIVNVRPVESPADEEGDEEFVILSGQAQWNQDWLVREVESLGYVRLNETSREPAYSLSIQERHTSWGADAASYTILLLVAQWALSSGLWDAVKLLGGKIASKALSPGDQPDAPLDEDEAVRRAKVVLYNRYSKPPDLLKLKSVELVEASRANLVFVDERANQYECDLIAKGPSVSVARIKKVLAEPR
jgi:hypothetical protein